jgi:hypothetical protein
MRSRLTLVAATITAAISVLHCSSQDDPGAREDVDAGSDANVPDTGGDAGADAMATDASSEDEY